MDFLNKAMAQLAELFRSMSAGSRVTAGLLLAVIVVSFALLVRWQVSGPDGYLMNGEQFPASQLPAMIAAFGEANLNDYKVEGTRIRVPRGQEAKYMAALAAKNALPHNPLDYLDRALNENPLWTDRHQRETRLRLEKQRAMSEILNQWPGIEWATVMIDEEDKPGYLKQKEKTASVTVKAEGTAALTESQIFAIRQFVASSVASLPYEKVALTDVNTGQTYRGGPENPQTALDDPYRARRRMDEKEWQEKILRALSHVPGATVSVTVELSPEHLRRERKVEHDPKKSTVLQTTEKTRTRTREGASPAGPAGYVVNGPAALTPAKGKQNKEEEEESDRQEVNAVGALVTETVTEGMTPLRVLASVQVPSSYFERVWRERTPAPPGEQPKTPTADDLTQIRTEEIAKIRKCVAALLPAAPGVSDPTELVTVTEFQSITPTPPAPPTLLDRVVPWLLHSWKTLGLVFLGLVSLVMLRSMIRAQPAESPSQPASLASLPTEPQPAAAESQESADAARQRRLKRLGSGETSLRDELSQLVAEDPDSAASILRAWIGNLS